MKKRHWLPASLLAIFPLYSAADQVIEEIVVVGIRPSASATWFAQFMYYQTDLYQEQNATVGQGGSDGMEGVDPEDVIDALDEDFGCNNPRITYENEMIVAKAVFMSDMSGRGGPSLILFLAQIQYHGNKYDIDWPNGSTGWYTVGLAIGFDPLTSRSSCE